jgi:site-specific DNA-methyltransferase (adenine-specific)
MTAAGGERDGEPTVVLDPFLGIGSTLLAAQKLDCRGIGMEIDPGYADAAAWRLRERLI